VLAGLHLPAVIVPHRPSHEERVAYIDTAIEEGLARPHALEESARVAQHGVKDPKPPAGRQDALVDDAPDTGDIGADFSLRERGDR
jgi:hypothetical protein